MSDLNVGGLYELVIDKDYNHFWSVEGKSEPVLIDEPVVLLSFERKQDDEMEVYSAVVLTTEHGPLPLPYIQRKWLTQVA